jgi:predicted alpha/beta-hydrolase family hydrolase
MPSTTLREPQRIYELPTPHGPARVHISEVPDPRAGLVLGHGAGGGVGAPDLQAAATAALELGVTVALVEQPYRVAGRRSVAPAKQLDAAWLAVTQQLRSEHELRDLRMIAGGRSSGARVACRTASEAGAVAVLCLAFPLEPPRRTGPKKSRLSELEEVTVPVLVVQGVGDRFGMPPTAPGRTIARVAGDHSLRKDPAAVVDAVRAWLAGIID